MNKLMQLINAVVCWSELEKFNKNEERFRGIGDVFDSWTGRLTFSLILAFGIFMGWVHIPTYMADGYSYDNFDRKEGDAPEYNYILGCYMDEWMSQVCRIPYWLSGRERNV
jgi:hypothetical protein